LLFSLLCIIIMPHWEGIEDSSSVAQRIWLSRLTDKDEWKPLRKCDCHLLNDNPNQPVYIEGGRATADPINHMVFHNFFRSPQRQLTSAIWFIKKEISSKEFQLVPISDEQDSANIEELYQKAVEASSSLGKGISSILEEEVTLIDESVVKIIKSSESLTVKKIPKGWFSTQYDLQRGYGEYSVDGEENENLLGPVRHLVFVIHGIGEALFSRDDVKIQSLVDQMNTTRVAMQSKQVELWKQACQVAKKAGQPEPPPPNRVEFLPIEWFNRLHDSSTALMQSLQATTLQSIPALRAIANDVVFDVLMYLTPNFCESVLDCVTGQVNDLYRAFQKVHPDFSKSGGKTSFIGHSLGSVIVWDLLSILKDAKTSDMHGIAIADSSSDNDVGYQAYAKEEHADKAQNGTWGPSLTKRLEQTIPFVPECTIFLGSPLGMFLTLRGAHPVFDEMRQKEVEKSRQKASEGKNSLEAVVEVPMTSPFTLPTGSLYNIFNPSDPVAYRIEPLLLAQDLAPDDLPAPQYLTAPGRELRLHVKAKKLGTEIRKSIMEQKTSWNSLIESAVSALSTTTPDNPDESPTKTAAQELKPGPLVFPLGGKSTRVDYSFQPGVIDNEYISAVLAHSTTTYFNNPDLQEFLLNLMNPNNESANTNVEVVL